MSDNCSDSCTCGANYKDETEHFQIHLIQELMDIKTHLGQANIMKHESHNLNKDHVNQITIVGSVIALSICLAAYTIHVIHRRN